MEKITSERFSAEIHPHNYPHESESFTFNKKSSETKQMNCSRVFMKNDFERPRVTSERNHIYRTEIADLSFQEVR